MAQNGTTYIDPRVNPESTKSFPRILCLHGGGTTAEIFRAQCRCLIPPLNQHFRLVFADGPFICGAGPGIHPVYTSFGPQFRRWLGWLDSHPTVDDESAEDEIEYTLKTAIEEDDRLGGTGPWVGILGFSQGAKIAASLLFDRQVGKAKGIPDPYGGDWKFAVIMAGRGPIVRLTKATRGIEGLQSAGKHDDGKDVELKGDAHVLKMPTIHVHGVADAGIALHRRLLQKYCAPGTTTLIEWNGDHRIPIKTLDVEVVTRAIFDVARKEGVIE
ncbi:citrinin biosynthesis oxidoreductase CtnB [Eremomyces bilateralis CBS 781.70]|uniref:Citrinin biosynthesis oxidoreductase CtnB n=1 Tax=Eremomyces bilateralis CBS 781.70 TaxID=1392243 RepID=A0A6G1FTG6_9PEZI|nr:citrinin biosynthesis oxidoreductase CtnB [Eremomyces bilateralis CBS 781.70]KAF1808969.1 citrinin biosynthesis oxidoreductase CtnB [Eremomyces bilateralis CBS 781.70]